MINDLEMQTPSGDTISIGRSDPYQLKIYLNNTLVKVMRDGKSERDAGRWIRNYLWDGWTLR